MERIVFGIVLVSLLTGCSLMDSQRCRELQSQGLVQGTLSSCTKCVGQLGPNNIDAINGCSLGMDAANLIGNANN